MSEDHGNTSDLKEFGRLVRERRNNRGWTQEDLASTAFSNLDRKGYISIIENGRQDGLKTSTIRSIATALDIARGEIPNTLRWPQASSTVRQSNVVIQDVYDQVAALVGREDDNAREIGFRDGTLIELAKRYTDGNPKNFDSAVANLSDALETTRRAIKCDELPEADERDYQKLLAKLADLELSIVDATTFDINRLASKLAKYTAASLVAVGCLIFVSAYLGIFHAPLRNTTIAQKGEIWSPGDCYKPKNCPGISIAKQIYEWADESCPLPSIFFGRCHGQLAQLLTGRRYISFVRQDRISDLKLVGPFYIETVDPFSIYERLAKTYPDCLKIEETDAGLALRVVQIDDICRNVTEGKDAL